MFTLAMLVGIGVIVAIEAYNLGKYEFLDSKRSIAQNLTFNIMLAYASMHLTFAL